MSQLAGCLVSSIFIYIAHRPSQVGPGSSHFYRVTFLADKCRTRQRRSDTIYCYLRRIASPGCAWEACSYTHVHPHMLSNIYMSRNNGSDG